MKKILIVILLIPFYGTSQNQNSVWIFGDSAGIDFSNINNPVAITSGMDGRGSCASISDSSGQLLFYSYTRAGFGDWAVFVHNNQNVQMPNGDSINGAGWYHELLIIPLSTNPMKYYLFSYGADNPNNEGLYYSIINMALNNGLGDVSVKDIQINPVRTADCITSVRHGNGRDWWVISKLSDTNLTQHNRFYKYLVTEDSVITYLFQDFNDATDADFQKIVWHPSGNKFMLMNIGGYMAEFSFDRCNGDINLIRTIFPEQTSNFNRLFWEGAYSPSGDVFYVSTDDFPGILIMHLLQYDLTATDIPASADTLDTFTDYIGTGAVRLAPDGKIYFSRACQCAASPYCYPYPDSVYNYINMNLSVINSPDSLGAACDYQPFSFYLGGKRTYYGLPNNPDYGLGALTGSICDSLTVGVQEVNAEVNHGKLYPNPSSGVVNYISELTGNENAFITIANTTGSVLFSKQITSNNQIMESSLLTPGIYYYLVIIGDIIKDKGKLIIVN